MAIVLLGWIAPSFAASYSDLQSKGYHTGKLTRGASGSLGWVVSNGKEKFFCPMRVGVAYDGKGMVGFTSSGRQISLDRKVYEQQVGGFDPSLPQLSDLRAGQPNARHVGSCHPVR
jgi:hypothetical protein